MSITINQPRNARRYAARRFHRAAARCMPHAPVAIEVAPPPVQVAVKPRKVAGAYEPDTGDPALDAFMKAHHDPNWKAPKLRMPRTRTLPKLSDARRKAMELDWNKACQVARQDIAAGRKPAAEIHLRQAIEWQRP